jgi:hypothetical protein
MPTGWTIIATPKELEDLYGNPYALKKEIRRRVTGSGAGLDEVYFDPSGRPAYALIHFPGNRNDAEKTRDKIQEALGADTLMLLTVEELEESESAP